MVTVDLHRCGADSNDEVIVVSREVINWNDLEGDYFSSM